MASITQPSLDDASDAHAVANDDNRDASVLASGAHLDPTDEPDVVQHEMHEIRNQPAIGLEPNNDDTEIEIVSAMAAESESEQDELLLREAATQLSTGDDHSSTAGTPAATSSSTTTTTTSKPRRSSKASRRSKDSSPRWLPTLSNQQGELRLCSKMVLGLGVAFVILVGVLFLVVLLSTSAYQESCIKDKNEARHGLGYQVRYRDRARPSQPMRTFNH